MELITTILAVILLVLSVIKSREKTKQAVITARGLFLNTFIDLVGVLLIVGAILNLIPSDLIKTLLGGESQILSTLWGTLIGTISIIPAFIAFPLSKTLLDGGAHLMTVGSFLTTLTMVGVMTFPIEVRHFGLKFTILRNSLSLVGAVIIGLIIGGVL